MKSHSDMKKSCSYKLKDQIYNCWVPSVSISHIPTLVGKRSLDFSVFYLLKIQVSQPNHDQISKGRRDASWNHHSGSGVPLLPRQMCVNCSVPTQMLNTTAASSHPALRRVAAGEGSGARGAPGFWEAVEETTWKQQAALSITGGTAPVIGWSSRITQSFTVFINTYMPVI